MNERRARACLAVVTGAAAALAAYAILRAIQVLFVGEANPVTVFARVHMAYFWRAWTSAFIGGMAALVALFAARDLARLARALRWIVPFATALLVAQSIFLP